MSFLCSLAVRIIGFHPIDRGSIPRGGIFFFGENPNTPIFLGRTPYPHFLGRTPYPHFFGENPIPPFFWGEPHTIHRWPSGLRRSTQVALPQGSRVRIPSCVHGRPQNNYYFFLYFLYFLYFFYIFFKKIEIKNSETYIVGAMHECPSGLRGQT